MFPVRKYNEEVEHMAVGPTFTTTYDANQLNINLTAYATGGSAGDLITIDLLVNATNSYQVTGYLTIGSNGELWSYFLYTPVNGDSIVVTLTQGGLSTPAAPFIYVGAIPCIPAGQLIRTLRSDVPVETVKSGDSILTPDGRSVVVKVYKSTALATKKDAPYLIPAHTFRPGYPKKDIQLSPHHKIQMGPDLWLSAEQASKLYPTIKQLVSDSLVHYFHFETPNFLTDDLIVEGSIVESYGTHYCEKYLKGKQPYVWSEKHKAEIRMVPGSWRV